jgi:TatD DNase family protein
MFADAHCHLYEYKNIAQVVGKARKNRVSLIISNAVDVESMKACVGLASEYAEVEIALGIHPANLLLLSEESRRSAVEFLERNVDRACAIGETGLDYKYADTERRRTLQKYYFRYHIELANQHGIAIVVHSRAARAECVDLLYKHDASRVLLHWFYAGRKTLAKVIDAGYKLSVGPSIFSNPSIQAMVRNTDLEHFLLETDGPVCFNGKPAEPSWIPDVCRKIAELKECGLEDVAKLTFKNTCELFRVRKTSLNV